MNDSMYVVVEWNQASGQPSIVGGDVFWCSAEAGEALAAAEATAKNAGRLERHEIYELTPPTTP